MTINLQISERGLTRMGPNGETRMANPNGEPNGETEWRDPNGESMRPVLIQ